MIGIYTTKKNLIFKTICVKIAFLFLFNVVTSGYALAQMPVAGLPVPGAMVTMTDAFTPVLVKGININPTDPLQFDFMIDAGDSGLEDQAFEAEASKLIKYFLASLTIPEEEMWVNLSPYEKDRIIPSGFGKTDMGKDMLALDYMLKQLTSSLMYPEDEIGSKFWKRVRTRAMDEYGTTEVPMNTFNKIWIVPQKASVYEHKRGAVVVDSHLKVMLEEDYVALQAELGNKKHAAVGTASEDVITGVQSEILREVIVPEIEKEVNQGETFAQLRQMFNSIILATWYKKNLKESLLGQVYVDQHKTLGLEHQDPKINQKIYDQYVEAFKTGVYDYIKEEYDPTKQQVIPRKYFSGGVSAKVDLKIADEAMLDTDMAMAGLQRLTVKLQAPGPVVAVKIVTPEGNNMEKSMPSVSVVDQTTEQLSERTVSDSAMRGMGVNRIDTMEEMARLKGAEDWAVQLSDLIENTSEEYKTRIKNALLRNRDVRFYLTKKLEFKLDLNDSYAFPVNAIKGKLKRGRALAEWNMEQIKAFKQKHTDLIGYFKRSKELVKLGLKFRLKHKINFFLDYGALELHSFVVLKTGQVALVYSGNDDYLFMINGEKRRIDSEDDRNIIRGATSNNFMTHEQALKSNISSILFSSDFEVFEIFRKGKISEDIMNAVQVSEYINFRNVRPIVYGKGVVYFLVGVKKYNGSWYQVLVDSKKAVTFLNARSAKGAMDVLEEGDKFSFAFRELGSMEYQEVKIVKDSTKEVFHGVEDSLVSIIKSIRSDQKSLKNAPPVGDKAMSVNITKTGNLLFTDIDAINAGKFDMKIGDVEDLNSLMIDLVQYIFGDFEISFRINTSVGFQKGTVIIVPVMNSDSEYIISVGKESTVKNIIDAIYEMQGNIKELSPEKFMGVNLDMAMSGEKNNADILRRFELSNHGIANKEAYEVLVEDFIEAVNGFLIDIKDSENLISSLQLLASLIKLEIVKDDFSGFITSEKVLAAFAELNVFFVELDLIQDEGYSDIYDEFKYLMGVLEEKLWVAKGSNFLQKADAAMSSSDFNSESLNDPDFLVGLEDVELWDFIKLAIAGKIQKNIITNKEVYEVLVTDFLLASSIFLDDEFSSEDLILPAQILDALIRYEIASDDIKDLIINQDVLDMFIYLEARFKSLMAAGVSFSSESWRDVNVLKSNLSGKGWLTHDGKLTSREADHAMSSSDFNSEMLNDPGFLLGLGKVNLLNFIKLAESGEIGEMSITNKNVHELLVAEFLKASSELLESEIEVDSEYLMLVIKLLTVLINKKNCFR